MFIAARTLAFSGPGEQVRVAKPGEALLDFASWPYASQQAAINLGYVINEERPHIAVVDGALRMMSSGAPPAPPVVPVIKRKRGRPPKAQD
jgi:hypothetical protein